MIALLATLLLPGLASAGHVDLSAMPPFSNTDGSPVNLTGAHYQWQVGCGVPGRYEHGPRNSPGPSIAIDALPDTGRCYFRVTVVDANGITSDPSDEAIFDFDRQLQIPSTPLAGPTVTWAAAVTPPTVTVSSINPTRYTQAPLEVGGLVYIDRSYTWTDVSTLAGQVSIWTDVSTLAGQVSILTANDDRGAAVSPGFTVNRNVTVYVAYDPRIAPVASWLSTWTDTNTFVRLSDSYEPRRRLYRKDFAAGSVTLGPNAGAGLGMYSVVVVPR